MIRTSGSHGYAAVKASDWLNICPTSTNVSFKCPQTAATHKDLPWRTTGRGLLAHSVASKADFTAKVTVKQLQIYCSRTHTGSLSHKQSQSSPLFAHKVKGTITEVIHIQAVNRFTAIGLPLHSQYTRPGVRSHRVSFA